jgi:hypothetical protein
MYKHPPNFPEHVKKVIKNVLHVRCEITRVVLNLLDDTKTITSHGLS